MMRHCSLKILSCLLLCSGALVGGEPIQLPSDPAVPVVEFWYVDQGHLGEPEVAVFSSGRVRVRVGDGAIWGELDEQTLMELVTGLLQKDQLARLKTEEIQDAIDRESARTGLSATIRNAGDTIIRVRTAQRVYRVDGHAVGVLVNRFPEVRPLQQLYSAQCRLENIRAVIMVGGTPAAERLARLAQARLQAESGEHIPVRKEDLACVHSLDDGTRCCQFVVRDRNGTLSDSRIVSLFESPGEAPRVSVLPDGPNNIQ